MALFSVINLMGFLISPISRDANMIYYLKTNLTRFGTEFMMEENNEIDYAYYHLSGYNHVASLVE